MTKPIIGITLDFPQDLEKNKYAAFPWYALRKNYIDCVISAGGVPICLPYDHENINTIANLIDGLIIPGGDCDMHPGLYNQELTSDTIKLNEERIKFEFELFEIIKSQNKPFLGICLGMQIMNISFKGDLIQHIPDHFKEKEVMINHEQPSPKNIPWHNINIKQGSKLLVMSENKNSINVNSTHHQAIGKVGEGLIVTATADDGIIEAIEDPAHKFMIGVQWHPEYLSSNPLDLNLFKKLIAASSER